MKKIIHMGQPTRDKRGRMGAEAIVRVGAKYPKRYMFATHGMTPEQTVEKIHALEARQIKKEQRIDSMQQLVGREFSVNLDLFRIVDATITERGSDTEVVINVKRQVGQRWERIEGAPIRKVVGPIEAVPDNAGIEALARSLAERWMMRQVEQEEFAAEVSRLLEEG